MKTAVEIYRLLPKTNCGKCGTGSCFGFAAKLATRQARAEDCPTMAPAARETLREDDRTRPEAPGTVWEQALASLQPRIQTMDFQQTPRLFGATLVGPDILALKFLDDDYRITKEKIIDRSGKQPPHWISILIYNHLLMPDPPAPSGEWITFSSVPASHAKDKAWAGHVEDVIAKRFEGHADALADACKKHGGIPADIKGTHDLAYRFLFFPHYPALLLFYDAVVEENFPAQCKLLLDKTAPAYLDIESIVVLGEEFAGRLTG